MIVREEKDKTQNEFCNHCGRSVKFKSGLFVNRIPDFNNINTRILNGLRFPLGDFVCIECDDKITEEYYGHYF